MMNRIRVEIGRIGDDLAVCIPDSLVRALRIREGDTLDLGVSLPRKSYLGALRGIGPLTAADRSEH